MRCGVSRLANEKANKMIIETPRLTLQLLTLEQAAYAARYVAKHIVAAGLAERCTVQISYAIAVPEPTSVYVNTHGTGKISDTDIADKITQLFDLTPNGIIDKLKLKQQTYESTAAYGHFGKTGLTWELLDESIMNKL